MIPEIPQSGGVTTHDAIRAGWPGATDEDCDHILWSRTPYPMGKITARSLYKAAHGFFRSNKNKRGLCDTCDGLALPGLHQCPKCWGRMHDIPYLTYAKKAPTYVSVSPKRFRQHARSGQMTPINKNGWNLVNTMTTTAPMIWAWDTGTSASASTFTVTSTNANTYTATQNSVAMMQQIQQQKLMMQQAMLSARQTNNGLGQTMGNGLNPVAAWGTKHDTEPSGDDRRLIAATWVGRIMMPDGSVIHCDKGKFRIEDAAATITYKANRVREFNRFLNASDLLQAFIKDVGRAGARQADVLSLPLELFINWLILKAAEQDQDKPAALIKPRCRWCARFISRARATAGILFCGEAHAVKFMRKEALA